MENTQEIFKHQYTMRKLLLAVVLTVQAGFLFAQEDKGKTEKIFLCSTQKETLNFFLFGFVSSDTCRKQLFPPTKSRGKNPI